MSEKRCYYEILGVAREVPADEVRKAYKREALKHHPDRNQGDAKSEAVFKEINEAYQVSQTTEKRQIYDQFGHAGLEGRRRGRRRRDGRRLLPHAGPLLRNVLRGGLRPGAEPAGQ
jgi:molecular chaperone DnaJ